MKIYGIVTAILLSLVTAPSQTWGDPHDRELISQLFSVTAPNGAKITPRYSSIDDVVLTIGQPSRKEYYKQGGEDFEWKDFWIYYYHADDLRIYFENRTRKVIRIFAYIRRLRNFHFPLAIENGIDLKELDESLNKTQGIVARLTNNWILYGIDSKENGTLSGLVSGMGGPPDDNLELYYSSPWKGY